MFTCQLGDTGRCASSRTQVDAVYRASDESMTEAEAEELRLKSKLQLPRGGKQCVAHASQEVA
jgi:hypothetical protein